MRFFLRSTFLRSTNTLGALALLAATSPAAAEESFTDGLAGQFSRAQSHVQHVWNTGAAELYVPLYTYHLPFAYTPEKIRTYQQNPHGLGYGRGGLDEQGDWRGVFALAFSDSHFKPQYMLGYGWETYRPLIANTRIGVGYSAGLTARSDILHYLPIPYALPTAALRGEQWSLNAAYVPGGKGYGNILFFTFRWHLAATPKP